MTLRPLFALLGACALLPATALGQFTITGVTDKQKVTNTITFTINTQAGYDYDATLNWKPIATGAPVVVNRPDFYELRVNATNQNTSAVTSQYLRFIVYNPERGTPVDDNTELGLPTHTPFPVIQSSPSEFTGAHFRFIVPASFPAGYSLPLVAWVWDDLDRTVRANGILKNSGLAAFQIKRGVGSGFLPFANTSGVVNLNLNLAGVLATNVNVAVESNVVWTPISGTLSGTVVWSNDSRIQITSGTIIPAGSSLTVGAGTIVRVNAGVSITNNGNVTFDGTLQKPIVVMGTTTAPWGGFVQHANNASFTATGTIFTGSGSEPCWYSNDERGCPTGVSGLGSHRTEQPLVAMNGTNCNFTLIDSAAIYLAGQLSHGEGGATKGYDVRLTRFHMQRATSAGQYSRARLTVTDTALIECPSDSVAFENQDHDVLYIIGGTHFFTNTLIGWTKDDGIDSGGTETPATYAQLTYQSCWFESVFHEGNSLSGYKDVVTRDTVYFDCGQGIENGYDAVTAKVERCFFSMNESGIRHGDNYATFSMYEGPMTATNNISIYNHRDLFGFNWDNSNNGGWTNNYARFGASNNIVSALDTNYPNNTLWNPATDAWRLGAFGGVGRVGVGFGARGSLVQLPDGIPVGLSRFCTNEVSVDYVIDGTDGTHGTGTLVFPAGLTRRFIPRPANTNGVWRFALLNAVNADVTGAKVFFGDLVASNPAPTLLVASNAVWKYFDLTNDLGTAWRNLGYDDSGWLSGAAQLGFGDDQATLIASNRQVTTYFRRVFNVGDPAFVNLSVMLLRDDAGVVFLNSNEVRRSPNLPAPPAIITNRTFATSTGENTIENFTVAASNLVAGANIVAVEMHQESLTSSDVSFALSITGNPLTRPRLAFLWLAGDFVIYSSDNTAVLEEASDVTGPWTPAPSMNTPTGFIPADGQRFYRLRK
jgi:hypothetical protein